MDSVQLSKLGKLEMPQVYAKLGFAPKRKGLILIYFCSFIVKQHWSER